MLLKHARVPFTDRRLGLKDSDWPAMKPTTPCGSLPVLKLKDGTQIGQAKTILRFLGKAHGYYPKDPKQGAAVDMLVDQMEDVWQATWKILFAKEG